MDRSVPRLALYALALGVLAVVLATGATSTSSLGTHNPSWDGTADLRALADDRASTDVVRNVSAYDATDAEDSLAVVLSPTEPYGEDAAAVRRFVERGGTLVVAEDYRANGNRLLAAVGATARFDGRPVRDERNYERTPTFVQVSVDAARPLTDGIETLVLNRGTTLDPGAATVLASTAPSAYLDADRDGELDTGETPAERPVLAVESVGEGRVVALSDPSIFINAMLEYGDNRAFATNLIARHDQVLFDVSHSPGVPPLAALLMTVRGSLPLQATIGAVLVVAVAGRHRIVGLARRIRRIGRSPQRSDAPGAPVADPEAIARAVRRDNPNWDEARIERIAESALPATDAGTAERTGADRSRDRPVGPRGEGNPDRHRDETDS